VISQHSRVLVVDGIIEIPAALRGQFRGEVNVIMFAQEVAHDPASWPSQNRRRWELIARKATQPFTDSEERELGALQQRADAELASLGPRPVDELEHWHPELKSEG
jgi:hypothetical protein